MPVKIMGILNVTPDSFSDGGRFISKTAAVERARILVAEGADIIDVGGESSRPGSQPVSLQEELDRVMPVLEGIRQELPVTLSIDTYKPAVMTAAIAAGATFINDIKALTEPGALAAVADKPVQICLMHMQGNPLTMQEQPHYENVVTQVYAFLQQRITACAAAGIAKQRLAVDPGFGFGKTLAHNLSLLKNLAQFRELGCTLLVGLSRKGFIGQLMGEPLPEKRVYGSLAAAVIAVSQGAQIIRTHDVAATRAAVTVANRVFE